MASDPSFENSNAWIYLSFCLTFSLGRVPRDHGKSFDNKGFEADPCHGQIPKGMERGDRFFPRWSHGLCGGLFPRFFPKKLHIYERFYTPWGHNQENTEREISRINYWFFSAYFYGFHSGNFFWGYLGIVVYWPVENTEILGFTSAAIGKI